MQFTNNITRERKEGLILTIVLFLWPKSWDMVIFSTNEMIPFRLIGFTIVSIHT